MGMFDFLFGEEKSKGKAKGIEKSKVLKSINSRSSVDHLANSENLMDADAFSSIIAKSKASSEGIFEKEQKRLKENLLRLSAGEIMEFPNSFDSLMEQAFDWDLWAEAYIIHGGCSDDCPKLWAKYNS